VLKCCDSLFWWKLLLPAMAVSLACGTPSDRCAAPGRAEIEAIERGNEMPAGIATLRDHWIRASLDWVTEVLYQSQPDTVRSPIRKQALAVLDDVLHLEQAPDLAAVADFYHDRINRTLSGIEGQAPESGAIIWKLYNHGFVVRTAGHCYAFDIFPGVGAATMSREQMLRLAGAVEVMFVSHRHRDHASREFTRLLLDLGKTVVVNPDIWPEDKDFPDGLVRIGGHSQEHAGSIEFRVFDGHQGDIPNNVYLVQTDGVSVMHTGDQYSSNDLDSWITAFDADTKVDVLLPNCWTMDIGRMVAAISPSVVITGHENELGHMVYKRESYGKSYLLLNDLSAPYVMMTWGESYHFN